MACFLVPTGEAIVATVVGQIEKKKVEENKVEVDTTKIPFTRKLKWLTNLLWGGAVLLAFEHLWHGEVVPFPPFLTAMNDPGDTAEMLHEMSTVGVTMAVIITVVWIVMCIAADAIAKRPVQEEAHQTI
ncbi:MAG: hypothetical protein IJU59_01855 [Firmicutes bacterium]|nr:hypothetical protein [Bacillota bacterium]